MSLRNELKKERGKDDYFKKSLDEIYNDCIKTIKTANKNGDTHMVYDVPVMLYSHPLYDIQKMTKKLHLKLVKKDLDCKIISNCSIFINWG